MKKNGLRLCSSDVQIESFEDLQAAQHVLEELASAELQRLERHLKAAEASEDFRALDALLQRAENARELGVEVGEWSGQRGCWFGERHVR